MLMPHVEPYFVRSIRARLPELGEPLRSRTAAYVAQEAQHHAQHRRFNALLAARCRGLARLERLMAATFARLGRQPGRPFDVAFAAGSETLAFGIARWVDRHLDLVVGRAEPQAATLFLWHLAEEVEHKSAAFDVFEATDGSRLRYAWATGVSAIVLLLFTVAGSVVMLRSARRLRYPVTWFRLTRWAISLAFTMLPLAVSSALPGHHPSTLADPPFLVQWLRGFDPASGTMPVWSGAGS
jgi:predicted metal-dependent hydrolase